MAISHRLRSSMYERPDEEVNEKPKRIVFLSVEGNVTEKNYFDLINKYKEKLGIKSIVHLETLSREDTKSDPASVLELLEDTYRIREEGVLLDEVYTAANEQGKGVSREQIRQYLDGELNDENKEKIELLFLLVGIDINYQKYLSEYRGEDTDDIFAVVVDRDYKCHKEPGMKQLIQSCKEKGYNCYITNPCFEFWLLLHVCDVKVLYSDHFDDILENKKVSKKHTYVSRELSNHAGHYKSISEDVFREKYLSNVDIAIKRAGQFETDIEKLLSDIGSNLPELFKILRA